MNLANESWFIEFLDREGFRRASEHSFSNGRASIRIEGARFIAEPGAGGKTWHADFTDAERSTITLMVEQVLKMRPFLSETDLADEGARRKSLQAALAGVAGTICTGPDTHSGVQLRRFLWSLYNSHHLVNLWRMTSVLDSKRAAWMSEIFSGALAGPLKEDDIKCALTEAGEMKRWDEVRPGDESQRQIDEALGHIEGVLRSIPPSASHAELKRARECLWEAQQSLRRAKEPERED